MLGALGLGSAGAAAAAAQSAYEYNLACFKFNAGTQQSTAFQTQCLQLAKWRLFREDVRDLFSLTSDNLHTYMVVGTLFVGFSTSFLNYHTKDFPVDPPWLMLFFGNSALAAEIFGLLGVWLAMHGVIAAHSSGVKLLTQAIRLPVPTEEDVMDQQATLADFEQAGFAEAFRIPRFWGGRDRQKAAEARIQEIFSDANGPGRSAAFEGHVRLFRQMHATYACYDAYARISIAFAVQELLLTLAYLCLAHTMGKFSEEAKPLQNKAFAWSILFIVLFGAMTLYKLDFYMVRSRMWIVKQVVISGPVCIALALHLWSSNRIPGETKCPEAAWKILLVLANGWHLSWHVLMLYWAQPSGPRKLPTAFRSVHFTDVFGWLDGKDARRKAARDALRRGSVLSKKASAGGAPAGAPAIEGSIGGGLRRTPSAVLPAGGGSSSLESSEASQSALLSADTSSCTQSAAEDPPQVPVLENSNSSLLHSGILEVLEEKEEVVMSQTSRTRGGASKAVSFAATIQEVEMTNTSTFQSQTSASSVRAFEPMVRRPGSTADASSMPWKYFAQCCIACIGLWTFTTVWDFYSLLTNNWQHDTTPPPLDWHLGALRQVSLQAMVVPSKAASSWSPVGLASTASAVVAAGFASPPGGQPPPPAVESARPGFSASWFADPSAAQVPVIWPHERFRPSGIACARSSSAAAQALLIADRFHQTHTARSPLLPLLLGAAGDAANESQRSSASVLKQPLQLSPLREITGMSPWQDFALLCGVDGDESCDSALVLQGDGRGVHEFSLVEDTATERDSQDGGSTLDRSPRSWAVSPMLNDTIKKISPFIGEDAAALCSASSTTSGPPIEREADVPSWLLYAVTSHGDVVALCLLGGALEPLFTLASRLPEAHGSDTRGQLDPAASTVLGLHVDGSGALWILRQFAQGGAELHAWAPSGAHRGAWRLPQGRTWSPGLCAAAGGGFLVAALRDVWGPVAHPELWRIDLSADWLE